ncbi:MAG: hypothetical protein ACRDBM_02175 [Sporomusa sp.]
MPKTVALAHYNQQLVNELSAHGFQVVVASSGQAKPGQTIDAYLSTNYRDNTTIYFTVQPDQADISIGNYHYTPTDHPAPIYLNITGLDQCQIAERLHHELARRSRP